MVDPLVSVLFSANAQNVSIGGEHYKTENKKKKKLSSESLEEYGGPRGERTVSGKMGKNHY